MSETAILLQPRQSSMRLQVRHLALLALTAAAVALPMVGISNRGLTIASQVAINAIFAASFHLMFGVAGMLWFGHAIFFGVSAYVTGYVLLALASNPALPIPVSLTPILGALSAGVFAAILGWVVTRREKLAFAMISLALAELVVGLGYIFRSLSGGEEGLSFDRWVGPERLGITFGPQIQVYYLTIVWLLVSLAIVAYLERTAIGKAALASKENPERLDFVGYDVRKVRWLVFTLAGGLAGISGALFAINYEHVGLSLLTIEQSAIPLFAVVIGGLGSLVGAVAGSVALTILTALLSDVTPAWLLYLGLLFTAVILLAKEGVAGAVVAHKPLIGQPAWVRNLAPSYTWTGVMALATAISVVALIELALVSEKGARSSVLAFGVATQAACFIWLSVGIVACYLAVKNARAAGQAFRRSLSAQGLVVEGSTNA